VNAVAEIKPGALAHTTNPGRMAVAEIISHVALVQEVMRAVMKPDVHYGVIPGTDKPTLYKQGAEVLCMAFRVADAYQVEDLSTPDVVRYRVTCIGTHQTTGTVLGTGMGEASSAEEKYKWRKAWDEEFDATPANMRRIKTGKYKTKQVRTEPPDLANTILKMANKRAKIAMTINVTACGDMFGQDLEDMDAALRDHLTRHGEEPQGEAVEQPQGPQPWPDDKLAEREAKCREWAGAGKSADDVIAFLASKGTLSDEQKARIRGWMKPPPQDTDVTDATPKVTYATLADRLQKCADADTAALILDEGRALPADQQADLSKLYAGKFGAQE
jgi:hypothetical protein